MLKVAAQNCNPKQLWEAETGGLRRVRAQHALQYQRPCLHKVTFPHGSLLATYSKSFELAFYSEIFLTHILKFSLWEITGTHMFESDIVLKKRISCKLRQNIYTSL